MQTKFVVEFISGRPTRGQMEEIELFSGVFVNEAPKQEEEPEQAAPEEKHVDYAEIAAAQRVDLLAHLRSMKKHVDEANAFIEQVISKISTEAANAGDGVSLLQVRNHCLLEYLENLSAFSACKASGQSVKEPVEVLCQNRCVLEKIKPLEHKLRYQLEKYREMEENATASLRANPAAMIEDTPTQHSDGLVAAQYQAPQISAVAYPNEADDRAKEARFARSTKAHSKKNALMEEVTADIRDDVVDEGRRAAQSRKVRDFMRRMKENEELEEEMMQRMPMSKRDRQMMKQLEQMQGSYQSILDYEKSGKKKESGKKKKKGKKH